MTKTTIFAQKLFLGYFGQNSMKNEKKNFWLLVSHTYTRNCKKIEKNIFSKLPYSGDFCIILSSILKVKDLDR